MILLVEDEPAIRAMVARILQGAGYVVMVAPASEAIAVARGFARKIDLLLTDVVMPDLSGPELAAAFCALRPGTKVLFISGHSAELSGATIDASQFLAKPFEPAALLARLDHILARASSTAVA